MASGRTGARQRSTIDVVQEAEITGALRGWTSPTGVVARSVAMIIAATLAILVLLPAVVAAQAVHH